MPIRVALILFGLFAVGVYERIIWTISRAMQLMV
jgi:hypothetical protein